MLPSGLGQLRRTPFPCLRHKALPRPHSPGWPRTDSESSLRSHKSGAFAFPCSSSRGSCHCHQAEPDRPYSLCHRGPVDRKRRSCLLRPLGWLGWLGLLPCVVLSLSLGIHGDYGFKRVHPFSLLLLIRYQYINSAPLTEDLAR